MSPSTGRHIDSRGYPGSGSLITAHYALEQGTEVFAFPGSTATMNAVDTNSLIKKDAKLFQKVDDILEELTPLLKGLLRSSGNQKCCGVTEIVTNLDGLEINYEEKAICNALGSDPRHIDIVSRETGITAQRVSGFYSTSILKVWWSRTEVRDFS